jgi:hypothetical protein
MSKFEINVKIIFLCFFFPSVNIDVGSVKIKGNSGLVLISSSAIAKINLILFIIVTLILTIFN